MVIEPCVVQFWSEIILVISNQTCAARLFNFEITHMISAQIALHSVQLPLLIIDNAAGGAAGGAGEQPQASKTGKYIAPSLREGAGNRRGETMPRSQRGNVISGVQVNVK